MTLVLRKLLASSTFAIAGALTSISDRLQTKIQRYDAKVTPEEDLGEDYES
jgi:adenine-specific DNA-methyltransferase